MPLSAREQKLTALIAARAGDLLADLRRHVALPTGGGNTAALDETRGLLVARLEALGAQMELVPGDPRPAWLYGVNADAPVPPTAVCRRTNGGDGAPGVLLAGHLDTVHDPASDFRELTVAADGKTATGPGCVDMKGGLVIAVAALEALEEAGIDCSWSFLMNSDEETGSYCSDRAIRAEAGSGRYGWGIAVEPALPAPPGTDPALARFGALAIERMGSGQFMIECRGRSAHVGRDFASGVSAVTALARAILKVAEMASPEEGRVVSVGPLQGGTVTNAVPDLARAWGNARTSTPRQADELAAMLEALNSPEEVVARGEAQVIVRQKLARPPKPLTPEVERLALAARAAAEDLGQTLPFAKTGGVCDGNNMQAGAPGTGGLATIDTLGVRGGGLHTRQEWIDLESLVERCQLLGVLLSRLAEGRVAAERVS